MHLTALDWWIVVLSIGISFLPAVLLARRAGSSTAEFFTSGRAAPWWRGARRSSGRSAMRWA